MKITIAITSMGLLGLLSSCREAQVAHEEEPHPVVGVALQPQDIRITEDYVSQIHSARHIEICAVESGYLKDIPLTEGQRVEEGDTLFKIVPAVYQAEVNTKKTEARLLELKYINTKNLAAQSVVSENEVALAKAEYDMAQSEVELAQTHLNFTDIKAPFSGIIDRFEMQKGSYIEEDTCLTTLSDNSTVWVYFNVSEARYLEYQAIENHDDVQVELILANKKKFDQSGKIAAIEADFNNETGNIAFRADFPNPRAPASEWTDRHHRVEPIAERCGRCATTLHLRRSRQALRLHHRQRRCRPPTPHQGPTRPRRCPRCKRGPRWN